MRPISAQDCVACLADVSAEEAAAHQPRFFVELGGPAPEELAAEIRAGSILYRRVLLDGVQVGLIAFAPPAADKTLVMRALLAYRPGALPTIHRAIDMVARELGCNRITSTVHRLGLVAQAKQFGYAPVGVIIERKL